MGYFASNSSRQVHAVVHLCTLYNKNKEINKQVETRKKSK